MQTIKTNTNPIIYSVEKEKKIYLNIIFITPSKLKNENYYNDILLTRLLTNYSNRYRTIESNRKAQDNYYILNFYNNITDFMNYKLYTFGLIIPKEGLIDEFNLEEAIKFFYDSLFDPYIEKDHFNSDIFNYEKKFLLNNLKEEYLNINEENYEEFNKFIDSKEEYYLNKKYKKELLDKIDEYTLYDYYLKTIKNNTYYTNIFGKIEKDRILKIYNKYFKQDYKESIIRINRFHLYPYKNYEYKVIPSKYKQSVLNQCYSIKNVKTKDNVKLIMLYYFLASKENNLIFNVLRNKHSLVYETRVNISSCYGYLYLNIFLDKKDLNRIKDLIKDTIYSIKNKKTFNKCKENLLISIKYDMLDAMDDYTYEVRTKLDRKYKTSNSLKSTYNKMKKIKYEDMLEFLNRLFISREMLLEGDINDKNN